MRFTTAGVVIFAVVGACADPQAATEACPSQFVAHVQDVPGVAMDVPPEPRPWDTSATALEQVIAQRDGHAVVAFKAPDSARALKTGRRAAVPASAIEQGFDLLAAHCVAVLDYWGLIGAAHVRMPPGAPTAIRDNDLVDYIEPRQWESVQGSGRAFSETVAAR